MLKKSYSIIFIAFSLVTIFASSFIGCSVFQNSGMLDTGEVQVGMASWYGKRFHGRITTNGERYNMNKVSAAHRALPFNTFVKVTNLKNNKAVVVRINDRGPWIPDRVIDLSYEAARKIGIINQGVARVRLEIVKNLTGIASWYSDYFHGKTTASGEIYDKNQLTAAHSVLPFGSKVQITNIENGKTVTVRINDRMPSSRKTIINVSRKAADKLDMLKGGVTTVIVDVPKGKSQ